MKLDPDMHIGMHLVSFRKSGVTILELDYVGLKVALFRCRWVTNGKRAVSKDKYGYDSVDLRVFGYKNEPFVFANDVEQVFYVPYIAKKN
jgi:hypothetical protein